ncbi:hypothetical protein BH10ACI4_BH10ACI4_09160 [soil metagenome]
MWEQNCSSTTSPGAAVRISRIMSKQKSVVFSLVLTFFFGPFGMLYSTIVGAVIMLVLYVVLGIVTFGWAIAALHPIAMIWGAVAANQSNK